MTLASKRKAHHRLGKSISFSKITKLGLAFRRAAIAIAIN
jgi:hypothetical protein